MKNAYPPPPAIDASILPYLNRPAQIWILTGDRQTGKSTWCTALVNWLDAAKIPTAGILTHAQLEDQTKTGIILEDINSGERKILARRSKNGKFTFPVGCWHFNPAVLAWGNTCLQQADGFDVVIFDESGPLELVQKQGLLNGLSLFDQAQFKLGIVVIRPKLLSLAKKRWPQAVIYQTQKVLA